MLGTLLELRVFPIQKRFQVSKTNKQKIFHLEKCDIYDDIKHDVTHSISTVNIL